MHSHSSPNVKNLQRGSMEIKIVHVSLLVRRVTMASLPAVILFCAIFAPNKMKRWIWQLPKKEKKLYSRDSLTGKRWLQNHQISECHKLVVDSEIKIPRSRGNILEITNEANKMNMQNNWLYLMKIIQNLQYLGRQSVVWQGKNWWGIQFHSTFATVG